MEQFDNNLNEEINEETFKDEASALNEEPIAEPSFSAADEAFYNEIKLSSVKPETDVKGKKGLKIFALCIAAVIVLTSATVVGYYFGENSNNYLNSGVNVDLAAKPKDTDLSTPAEIYEKLNESVVGIFVYNSEGESSEASGVIYSEEGYIVTNDHIYSEISNPKFRIYLSDGSEYNASYVAGDSISDLAVLKIKSASKKFKAPEFGDSKQLVCGESVVAIGKQSGAADKSAITEGVISLTGRRVQTTSSYSARLIQCDSAINPGSSGGALSNLYGQIVGITSSKLAGVDYDSVCFAIPTTTVKRIADQLISKGKVVDRAKLGITYSEITSIIAELNNYSATGLYVVSVSSDSDLSGKVSEGDIITHFNGIKITNDDIVLDALEDCKAGDKVKITVLNSKGSTNEYEITLKANIGESSYNNPSTSESNGGTFNFPSGE